MSCYKSHLQTLKKVPLSTDDDLLVSIIIYWKCKCWYPTQMHCTDTGEGRAGYSIRGSKHYGSYTSYQISMDREGRYCDSNIEAVKERVAGLLKGCRCETGCQTQCCGYKGKGKICSEGCECTNCLNTQTPYQRPSTELYDLTEMSMEEIIAAWRTL